MVLMMITFIAPATEGTSAVSLSLLIVFVELAEEKFTMLNWKLDPSKLGFS